MGFCDALLITTIAKITPEQPLFVQSTYSVTILINYLLIMYLRMRFSEEDMSEKYNKSKN